MEGFFYSGAESRNIFRLCSGEYRGSDRLIHICQYAQARAQQEREERFFRYYLTDALYAINKPDMQLIKRYRDYVEPKEEIEENPQEIINRIKAKLREEG